MIRSSIVGALLPLGLGLIVMTTAACESMSPSLTPSASTTTLMAGWEQHFKLDWTVQSQADNTRQLSGSIHNQHGELAEDVRLLAQALDASGAVVGQRIAWVPGGVSGFGRAYYVIQHLPAADHYKVTVWTYTFHQSADGVKN